MSKKDFHNEPFDEGTIKKLEIFKDYAEAWIPTFVMQRMPQVHIFDYFAGPGYDINNVPGSPILYLQTIKMFTENIFKMGTKIFLHLNEFDKSKFNALMNNCDNFLEEFPHLKRFLTVKYYNDDFEQLFFEMLPTMKNFPSLVYIDQTGIKYISSTYINELESMNQLDFIYFISSSSFSRFRKQPEFLRILEISSSELENAGYTNIHRLVSQKIKEKLPSKTLLKLYPFTLKKGANIYGIVFGSKHIRAVDKFLGIAWKRNHINGEADFDIDDDIIKDVPTLFGKEKLTKIEQFQNDLETKLKKGELRNNKDVLIYTYENGHIPRHAQDLVSSLKNNKKINYSSKTPCITYESAIKNKIVISFEILIS